MWRTCGEQRSYWTNFLSHECFKKSYTPPRVLCNSWCTQVGCPPCWGKWWIWHFFTHLWYSFNTLGSTLESGVFSDPSTMSQRSMEAKTIFILNFIRLNFSPWIVNNSSSFPRKIWCCFLHIFMGVGWGVCMYVWLYWLFFWSCSIYFNIHGMFFHPQQLPYTIKM